MSLAEVKASIKDMSVDERLEIAVLIALLNRAADPGRSGRIGSHVSNGHGVQDYGARA
jgi:hypothetical protein